MENYEQYRQSLGQSFNAPDATTPAPIFSQDPEFSSAVQKYYSAPFRLGASDAATGALVGAAGDITQQREAAARAAHSARIKAIEDMNDPKKYQKVKKPDGGFDYFDPLGKKISVATYARVQGKNPQDILKDSENELDKQFLQDYERVAELRRIRATGDVEALKKIEKKYPGTSKAIEGLTADQLAEDLFRNYPNIFQEENVNASPRAQLRAPGQNLLQAPQGQRGSGNRFIDTLSGLGRLFGIGG